MKWFKHDADAHADAKLRKVRLKYGMQGYGLYWYCLELIARGVEKHRLTFELEHDAELISHDTGISREMVEDMMRYMAEIGLFEQSHGVITCLKMASRTDEYTTKLLSNRKNVPIVSRQRPDSLGTKSVLLEEKRTEQNRTEQINPSPDGEGHGRRKRRPPAPVREIVDLYLSNLPDLPGVVSITDKRKRHIEALHAGIMEGALDNWRGYFQAVGRSDFLTGKVKEWRADFDFLIKPETPIKVLEGKYA